MKKLFVFFALISSCSIFSQGDLEVKGIVLDRFRKPIKFASVSVPKLYLGTTTTEEGKFSIILSESDFTDQDVIQISSFGNETLKMTVKEYIALKEKVIVIGGDVISPKQDKTVANNNSKPKIKPVIKKKPAKEYLRLANKYLKRNTINTPHQLKMLYRRFSVEDKKARFLVEHIINVLDKGPLNGNYKGVQVLTGRQSEDHRLVKKTMMGHPVNQTAKTDPQRIGIINDNYAWKIVGSSSYDGEDIVIIEGKNKKNRLIRFYIGVDTYGIYKIEKSSLSAVYIYSKDEDGKLHLSYHNRTRPGKVTLTNEQKRLLNTDKDFIRESYKHEVFVLGVKRLVDNDYDASVYVFHRKDIGDIETEYNPKFWQKLNLPPSTAFYLESIEEIEKISGKPIEKQFNK